MHAAGAYDLATNTVTLTDTDFTRYVLNNWEWQRSFAQNTSAYLDSLEDA